MSRKRILVVEDDRSVRQLYQTALTFSGFSVESASDGLDALRRIDEERPDLIVLDLDLPRVNGLAVLDELRAHRVTWSIPVIVVTGADYENGAAQASAILRKPCEPEALISAIEYHLQAAA
jgi:DNA-binding response OmpR family regulator